MGSMTCVASPPAIFGCACRIPSKIHSTPNPVRSSHRARASAGSPAVGAAGPSGTRRAARYVPSPRAARGTRA